MGAGALGVKKEASESCEPSNMVAGKQTRSSARALQVLSCSSSHQNPPVLLILQMTILRHNELK